MQTTQQNIETLTRKAVDHELLAELAVEEETRKKNTALASPLSRTRGHGQSAYRARANLRAMTLLI